MIAKKKASVRKASARSSRASSSSSSSTQRLYVARPDVIDFRDVLFIPTLVEVPERILVSEYKKNFVESKPLILDQGKEGACTGFGLAAVANYLLNRRKVDPDRAPVSPRMLYDMARRYDEWSGEDYDGSSARGAIKGWHKHGVCREAVWKYVANDADGGLTHTRSFDAAKRPLGAYFRVNHRSLAAMHSALAEVGALFATSTVHTGWHNTSTKSGDVPYSTEETVLGGHAFAIVGYDEKGFWIQNSWGTGWGKSGFGHVSYADWLENGTDVWVARLGVPTMLEQSVSAKQGSANTAARYAVNDLLPHVVSLGNDGALRTSGDAGTSATDVERIFGEHFPRITKDWKKKRILFYAHGGLVSEKGALYRVAQYREKLLAAEVYPVAFVGNTDFWTTASNIMKDAVRRRRPEGVVDALSDFMFDRLDDTLEVIARAPGRIVWDEMKENALRASATPKGGVRQVLGHLQELIARESSLEIHVAAHSAGAILLGPFVEAVTKAGPRRTPDALGARIKTCTLWAPACSMKAFKQHYLPAIRAGQVQDFGLWTLKDAAERDDNCADLYHKSLLYLVSKSFEVSAPSEQAKGMPILGMEKFITSDREFQVPESAIRSENPSVLRLFGLASATWVRTPNGLAAGDPHASDARHHGDFDHDAKTVQALLARILGTVAPTKELKFARSAATLADRRRAVAEAIDKG